MATVPVLPTGDAQLTGPTEPDAHVQPITEYASGEGVAKAGEALGRSAEQFGHSMSANLIYQQRLQQQEAGQDAAYKFIDGSHDIANPLLQRNGRDAKGVTQLYMAEALKQKKQMGENLSGQAFKIFNRYSDSHMSTMREKLIDHETKQFQVAADDSDNALHQSLMQTAALAPNAEEFKKNMAQGDELVRNMAARKGRDISDKNISKMLDEGSHSAFFDHFMKANLENNPKLVQDVLNQVKGDLPATTMDHAKGVSDFQKTIDGKMLDVNRQDTWDKVSKFRHEDGSIDLSKAETAAQQLVNGMPADQQQHIVGYVKSQAAMANAAIKDQREGEKRSFFNDAMALKQKGMNYQQAEQELFKNKGYGQTVSDHDDMQKHLQQLYLKDDSFYSMAMKHQTEDQKLAWQQVKDMSKAKFGTQATVLPGDESSGVNTPLSAAFVKEVERKFMGKPAGDIIEGAKQMMENKVVEQRRFWFDKKVPSWQIERAKRTLEDQQMFALEQQPDYSPLVGPMKQALIKNGIENPSPRDIRDAIDKYRKK